MNTDGAFIINQGGRSLFGVSIGLFVGLLAVGFWLTGNLFARILSLVPLILFFSALYALIRDESWFFKATADDITWDYARWPKSKGRVQLSDVDKIVIDEARMQLNLGFRTGKMISIKYLGRASKLHRYLRDTLPGVEIQLIEDSGS